MNNNKEMIEVLSMLADELYQQGSFHNRAVFSKQTGWKNRHNRTAILTASATCYSLEQAIRRTVENLSGQNNETQPKP